MVSGGQARAPGAGAEAKTRTRGCNNTNSSFGNRGPSPSYRKETRGGVTSFPTGERLRGRLTSGLPSCLCTSRAKSHASTTAYEI